MMEQEKERKEEEARVAYENRKIPRQQIRQPTEEEFAEHQLRIQRMNFRTPVKENNVKQAAESRKKKNELKQKEDRRLQSENRRELNYFPLLPSSDDDEGDDFWSETEMENESTKQEELEVISLDDLKEQTGISYVRM